MTTVIDEISKIGIVPVIAIDDAKDAVPLAKALIDGGLNCAEVTFRTAAAADAIVNIVKEFPDMLVGAGTILNPKQADEAIAAGAKFIVSPGFNPKTVAHCISKNIPIIPGTSNPSDIEMALDMGLSVVKFFPAEPAGGLKMLKAMSAPYGSVRFMPTGGINEDNLGEYLAFDKIVACGGSWMVKKDMIAAGKFDEIEALTRQAVTKMLGYEILHVGINMSDESSANDVADKLAKLFGQERKEGNLSIFVGDMFDVLKTQYKGSMGHIAIGTNSIKRAMYQLENQGVKFDESTASYDAKGNLKVIYLAEEIGGFAIHLTQK